MGGAGKPQRGGVGRALERVEELGRTSQRGVAAGRAGREEALESCMEMRESPYMREGVRRVLELERFGKSLIEGGMLGKRLRGVSFGKSFRMGRTW